MPNSSDIDNALLVKLQNDATLMALMPNLAHWDLAPDGATRFVIVSLSTPRDVHVFGARALEDNVYIVKAVGRESPLDATKPDMNGAAARIDALLEGGTLTAAGYTLVAMYRDDELPRIRQTERDDVDTKTRWHHRGGYYRVVMSL